MRNMLLILSILISGAASVNAVEPNLVRSTVFSVGKDNSGNDKDLVTTIYTDGLGRQIQSKMMIDDDNDRVSCTFYNEAGRPDKTTKTFVDEVSPGTYLSKSFTELMDATNGQLRKQTGYNGDEKPYSYSKYSDDPLSRIIEQNGPGKQFENNAIKTWYFGVSKETNTIGPDNIDFVDGFIITSMNGTDFDDELNALSDYLLNGIFTNPTYFLTVTKDARGNYTQVLTNLLGKTEATRVMVANKEVVARYTYDILGNLLAEKAPKPTDTIVDTKYTYNTLGQLINKTTPDGGTFGFSYTPSGQLACDTSYDAASGTIHRIRRYRYDDLDRLIVTELKNDNDLVHDNWTAVMKYYYDNIDELSSNAVIYNTPQWMLLTLENLKGRLVASVAINKVNGITYYVSDLFSYTDEGLIGKKIKIVPGLPSQEIFYTYDLHGKVLTETTECGGEQILVEYQYDGEGRLEKVVHVNNGNKILASYSYDELGRLDKKNLAIGTGREIEYGYNIREWTKSISAPGGTSYPNKFEETIPDAQYLANGNIGYAAYNYTYQGAASSTQFGLTYAYDEANRLSGVTPDNGTDYTASYTYDVLGRFQKKTEGADVKTGYAYYTNTNRLNKTATGGNKYYYDKHGNIVVDVNKKMAVEYDWRDMPVTFRFYNEIPAALPPLDSRGTLGVNPLTYFESAQKTLLSQVIMLYDASGNRVLKMEGK